MLRTVIIDDEPKGRKLLQQMVEKFCPDLEVSALAASAEEGIRAIKEFKPDLVFLDVEMPGDGFGMLNSLGTVDFTVIFVTGHQHYAIRAIKASALDYLLKPINPAELRAAVNRALTFRAKSQSGGAYEALIQGLKHLHTKVGIPTQKGLVFVESTEILRCEADSNYTRIFLKSGERHYAAKTLKEFEFCSQSLVACEFMARATQDIVLQVPTKIPPGAGKHVPKASPLGIGTTLHWFRTGSSNPG